MPAHSRALSPRCPSPRASSEQPLPAFQPGFSSPAFPRLCPGQALGVSVLPLPRSAPRAPRSVPLGVTDRGSDEPRCPGRAPRDTPRPRPPADTEPLPTRPWHVRPANSSCPERPGLQPQGSAGRGCGSRVRAWPKPPRALGTAGATRPQVRGCSVPVPVCPSVVGVPAVALCDTGAGQGPR